MDMKDTCWYWYGEGATEEQIPLYGYEGCVLTAMEWSEDPWGNEEHIYYETYNDGDLVCLYLAEENYETCYAYYKIEDSIWEFAPGGAWIWNECGEEHEESDPACDMGGWDIGRDEWQYDGEAMNMISEWDDEYFWECGSHEECSWDWDRACAVMWRGSDMDDGMWEWGQTCVEWDECDNTYTNQGEWAYVDCWADGRFESAMKATLSMAAGLVVLAYAM